MSLAQSWEADYLILNLYEADAVETEQHSSGPINKMPIPITNTMLKSCGVSKGTKDQQSEGNK